jgi:RNA polymerase sigma-70 factor (ECF subfamily)
MGADDKQLCRQAQQGDHGAASRLLDRHYRRIYSYLRRLCGNRHLAEDLTQETFAKAWASLDSYQSRGTFNTWIHTIAYRVYVDWTRRNGNRSVDAEPWWAERSGRQEPPTEVAAKNQQRSRLREAIARLDDDKKQIVHLRYYQDLSVRDTAKVLNIARRTVQHRTRETIRILRSELNGNDEGF